MAYCIENARTVNSGQACELHVGKLIVYMFRSERYVGPTDGLEGYLPSEVVGAGRKSLWKFTTSGAPTGAVAQLYLYGDGDDDFFIVTVHRDKVLTVRRIKDMLHSHTIKVAGVERTVGGTSHQQLVDIKRDFASQLGLGFTLTAEERVADCAQEFASHEALSATSGARQQARADKMAAQAAVALKESQARAEKVAAIMARQHVDCFTEQGAIKHGVPVLDSEWQSLSGGTYCVLVQNKSAKVYMPNSGWTPVEVFVIEKVGARVGKKFPMVVTPEMPSIRTVAGLPDAIEVKTFPVNGVMTEAIVFSDMEHVQTHRAAGLNNGNVVAVPTKEGARVTGYGVYAVYLDRIDTLTHLRLKTA